MLIYFPHIPKTGGQTLLQAFYFAFGYRNCVKVWDPNAGADVHPAKFSSYPASQFNGMSAVIGHLSFSRFLANTYTSEALANGRVRALTSVRDPLDRIVSLYNYISLKVDHPRHGIVKEMDPVDFLLEQPANFQWNYLALKPDAEILQLFEKTNIFPIERSTAGWEKFFESELGLKLPPLQVRNRSVDRAPGASLVRRENLPKAVLEKLQSKHSKDISLYQLAQKRWTFSCKNV